MRRLNLRRNGNRGSSCRSRSLRLRSACPERLCTRQGDRQAGPTDTVRATGDSAFAGLDACKLLSPDELQQHGVRTRSEPLNEAGETGCDFKNAADVTGLAVNLVKSPESIDSFTSRSGDFLFFKQNSVNGRPGFQASASDRATECAQFLSFGAGLVSVAVTRDKSGDPGGDATRLAQLAEPRLLR